MQNGANPDGKISRIRAAWYVLLGQRVTPQQIAVEWAEYQHIFGDILERWSAMLARQARVEKDRIKRLDMPRETNIAPPISNKAELRSKVAQMRGLTRPVLAAAANEKEREEAS